MQVSIQTTSGLERKLTVGVPAERVDGEVNVRLQKASKTVKLDGFRPGKVPMKVMKQRFGAGVRQEVLQEVMNQTFNVSQHIFALRDYVAVIIGNTASGRHVVGGLLDNFQALAHFLHPHQVTGITITPGGGGHFKIKIFIARIGKRFA